MKNKHKVASPAGTPNWEEKGAKTPKDRAMVESAKQRAFFAMYAGPFKKTPMFVKDPVHAFPFEGRGMMSQKMDGMYMLWDGKSQMYNRGRGGSGAPSHAQNPPESFYKHLPPVELEGELCYSSGEFSRGHSAKADGWQNACLFVWDAPLVSGPYSDRFKYVETLLAGYDARYVRPVPFLGIAKTRRVLDATLAKVRFTKIPRKFGKAKNKGAKYEGGEGVMIRDPAAPYTYACFEPRVVGRKKGQTGSLYKWLQEYGNDECKVTGKVSDSASLRVVLPNGTKFELCSIAQLGVPTASVAIGSIITFTYRGWAQGLPLGAAAQAFRFDRTWQDIVDNFIPPPNLAQGLTAGPVHRQCSLEDVNKELEEAEEEGWSQEAESAAAGFHTSSDDERDMHDADDGNDSDGCGPGEKKRPCQYGTKCYNKGMRHLAKFTHSASRKTDEVKADSSAKEVGKGEEKVKNTNLQTNVKPCGKTKVQAKTTSEQATAEPMQAPKEPKVKRAHIAQPKRLTEKRDREGEDQSTRKLRRSSRFK